MGNKVFLLPVIAATTFFILLFTFTKLFGPIPFSVSSVTTQKSTTFDVTGTGKVSVKPDIASVSVGISATGPTVKAAQDQINNVSNKVSQALKSLGIDPKDIETTNYNVNPEYDYTNGQKIKGYASTTNLLVKVREIEKINQVIDTATANGANQVSGVNFEVDDKTKAENEARQKAVDEAKKKAEDAAKIAGFKLGRIVNYSENLGNFGGPVPMVRALDAKGNAENTTQVEPGSTDITVNVTLSYDLL
jgi:uncharacterized protein